MLNCTFIARQEFEQELSSGQQNVYTIKYHKASKNYPQLNAIKIVQQNNRKTNPKHERKSLIVPNLPAPQPSGNSSDAYQ
jgi:hypothetical protein